MGHYALLIGESNYPSGWQNLNSIPWELQQIETLLQSQGFLTTILNFNAEQLRRNIEDFIKQYGFQQENRLLFFYAGHGLDLKFGRKNRKIVNNNGCQVSQWFLFQF